MRKPLSVLWLLATVLWIPTLCVLGQTPSGTPEEMRDLARYVDDLKASDQRTRLHAAEAIGTMGPKGQAAVPALVVMLNSEPTVERIAAAMALSKIGPQAKPAIPDLHRAAESSDGNLKKIALLAIDSIEPSVATRAWSLLDSPYILAGLIAAAGGLVTMFILWRRHRSTASKDAKKAAAQPTTAKAAAQEKRPEVESSVAEASPASVGHAKTTGSLDRAAKQRNRVSRQLPGLANYVHESEGPDSVKRELVRAQEEIKRISKTQQELDDHLADEEVIADPARARALRKDADVYATERYQAEIRMKALEIKMLEVLLGGGGTADAELRARSEVTLKQKWDALRTLCETPSKIVYRSGQWVSVPTGPVTQIADMRAWLRDHDIVIPERSAEEMALAEAALAEAALAEPVPDEPALAEPAVEPTPPEPEQPVAEQKPEEPSSPV